MPASIPPRALSLARRRHHPRAGRAERPVRDVGAGDRLVAQAAAEGDGAGRAAAALRPRSTSPPIPAASSPTVQIGITLIGILAGAYSGASLGGPTGERLALLGIARRHRSDARLHARHRAHHLCLAGDRRARAQAVRVALARGDRGGDGVADALAFAGDRALRLAARPDQRADLPAAPDEPRIGRPCHRRGSPPGRRRGGDRRRARGKRASDHLGRRPPRRPARRAR